MYLLTIGRLVVRRWLLCLFALAAAMGACVLVSDAVAVDHEATSQMLVILPPDATGAETPTNPYLNLPEGLITTAGLIAGDLSTKDSQRALAAEGDTADYTIAVVEDAGPLLSVTATAADAGVALATRDALMNRVDQQLAERQDAAGVPAEQVMRATRSSVSQEAEPLTSRRTKAVVATFVATLLLALLLVAAADQLLDRRRTRRESTRDHTEPGLPDPDAEVADAPTDDTPASAEVEPDALDDRAPGSEPGDVPQQRPQLLPQAAGGSGEQTIRSAADPGLARRQRRRKRSGPASDVAIADTTVEDVQGVAAESLEQRSMAG